MTSTSTSFYPKDRPLMPGSFGPEDFVDFYSNPLDALEQLQQEWRSRDHGLAKVPELDVSDVDWHKYDPPRSVKKAPNVTSHLLLGIIASSIENIKTRVAEEDRQKRQADEERLAEEDAARLAAAEGKEPYLPIIIVREIPKPEPTFDDIINRSRAQDDEPGSGDGLHHMPAKVEKRRKFALRRFFQRSTERAEKGESSAAGSAREALRRKLESKLGESAEARDPETWAALQQMIPGVSESNAVVECVSCLDDFPAIEAVKVVCHSYCSDCFVRLITTSMDSDQQWPPKCCLNPIPFAHVLRSIPDHLKAAFQEKVHESEVPVSDRIYCHEADCGVWVRPDRIVANLGQARCEQGHWTCVMCRGAAHGGQDCPHDRDMNLTNILAEEEGWKRCYNCRALVEHGEACQHMTCRCGTQFCYVCGERWRTCSCSMQQLYDLKEAAAGRRAARLQRERDEADELRELLAQIEEFEREEELKAELLRQEQVRLEEDRRQRELEERVRQESLRRQEVELKYQEMRESLDILHELQQVLLEMAQETEAVELGAENKAKREHLTQKHTKDREDTTTRIKSRLSTKEAGFNKDYATRLVQEKKIEEEYHQQLKSFWCGKKDGPAQIEQGMLPLRHRMDQNHRAWQRWKDSELGTYEAALEDERTIREELMYSAEQRLHDSCDEAVVEMGRRRVAEIKWLEVLMLERERLLGEMEVEEMEGDADSLFAPDPVEAGDDAAS